MTITPQHAAEALQLVEASKRRSIELRHYQSTAPHLMLWGALWALGYVVSYFAPAASNWAWLAIVAGGWSADVLIARKDHQLTGKRFFGLLMTLGLFTVSSIVIMAPHSPNQVAAFIPIIVAACYVSAGLFELPRLLLTGVGVFGLTLIGYFAFPGIFLLWMAVVGGGGLTLGGMWLRQA